MTRCTGDAGALMFSALAVGELVALATPPSTPIISALSALAIGSANFIGKEFCVRMQFAG